MIRQFSQPSTASLRVASALNPFLSSLPFPRSTLAYGNIQLMVGPSFSTAVGSISAARLSIAGRDSGIDSGIDSGKHSGRGAVITLGSESESDSR